MQYKDLSESEQQSDSDGLHVKMGHTLFCVLSLFLLSALIHGNAEEPVSKATLTADKTTIPVGGSVTLSCSVDGSDGWTFYLYRRISDSSQPQTMNNNQTWSGIINVSEGGLYYCRGGRGDQLIFTSNSSELRIEETVSSSLIYGNTEAVSASLTLHQNWNQIFSGESITLTCDIQGGGGTEWTYEWTPAKLNTRPTHNEHVIDRATESDSGNYRCRGKKDFSLTEWSNVLTLTISADKPKPTLTADKKTIRAGERVTLTCSVDRWDGWTFYWYRRLSDSSGREDMNNNGPWDRVRVISEAGLYSCRGGRGDPLFFTEFSNEVRIEKIVPTKVTVSRRPSWSHIYSGEKITVTCQIEGGTEWTYEWTPAKLNTPPKHNEHVIDRATESDSGNYWCRGKKDFSLTEWSNVLKLTISDKPRPVLTVSPSWLSPGASVTLNCEVEHPSAGWRFYWYKTVPDLSDKYYRYYRYYRYELLPGRDNGTEQNSSIIHGQTHTAGYVCKAGRGDSVYYTDHSEPKFVWSGDVHSSASLTVNPDRVQHFTSDSVSLSCEGNSTEWRVMRFPDGGFLSHCYHWGTMTGSTCKFSTSQSGTAVYWCESGSGEFSNSVNITVHNTDIILVSPVHPVTEGESVTVGCKLRSKNFVSSVFFYQNDKLRQNDTRQELNISAVSKSDEGFYKCQYSGKESPQSWLTVNAVSKHESSSLPVALIIGLVCGILLIIFLMLLYHFRQSKDSCFVRQMQSDSTSRDSSTNHGVNRNEKEHNEYCSPLRGEACIYESIKDSGNTGNGESQEVTYSLIELKHIEKKCKDHKPEERPVYSDVKTETTGKSSAAATDESVYYEIKPGTAVGL